jgi:hypothetical protein
LIGADDASGSAIAGSDVVVLRYFEEIPQTVEQWIPGGGVVLAPGMPTQLFAPYGITSCREVSLFQATAAAAGGLSGGVAGQGENLSDWRVNEENNAYGTGSLLYRYQFAAYYVGRGAQDRSLSLFRIGLRGSNASSTQAIALSAPEEIVGSVEMMQVLLGLVDAGDSRVDIVTSYQSADELLDGIVDPTEISTLLRRISSVRLSMLIRSPDVGAGENPSSPTSVVGDVVVTAAADRHIRHTYDSMVALRNRVRN